MGSIPGTLANIIRGSVLLVAGVITNSEDAISLGRQIAAGYSYPSPEELLRMQEELDRWKEELRASKDEGTTGDVDTQELQDELEKREAELKNLEEKHKQWEEGLRSYPLPSYLARSGYHGTFNIAVVGNCGVGKSLLVNGLRGVKAGEPNWAAVGVNQTTTEPGMYELFPDEPGTRIWDLAGAGSQLFPRGGYTRSIGLRYFDVIIVVTTCRFTQTEVVLLSESDEHNVPRFVVRTMVDVDITSNLEDHGKSSDETKMGILDDLCERGIAQPYLVNARCPDEHDFPRLVEDLQATIKSRRDGDEQALKQKIEKFEAGDEAEVWSKHFNLWVKCNVEGPGDVPERYHIFIPMAPPGVQHLPNVPVSALRKSMKFEPGDDAELVVMRGPLTGSWTSCTVTSKANKPDTYLVSVPAFEEGQQSITVHCSCLRKCFLELPLLLQMLADFKEKGASQEFQDTISTLRERGMTDTNIPYAGQLFIATQLNTITVRYNLHPNAQGWKDLINFIQTQKSKPEVVKATHEAELGMGLGIGSFFGIPPEPGEQVKPKSDWRRSLRTVLFQSIMGAIYGSHKRAEARASIASPHSGHTGMQFTSPMSRMQVTGPQSWFRPP